MREDPPQASDAGTFGIGWCEGGSSVLAPLLNRLIIGAVGTVADATGTQVVTKHQGSNIYQKRGETVIQHKN